MAPQRMLGRTRCLAGVAIVMVGCSTIVEETVSGEAELTMTSGYGGGIGYPNILDSDHPSAAVVSTAGELEAALAAATPGRIVYVADDARIDLSRKSLCIPAGVTLASGRGRSAGGLLFTTVTENKAMLQVCGDDVRVTGLRIAGSEPTQCPPEWPDRCEGEVTGGNCRDCMPRSRGIQSKGKNRLVVDNCELTGFTYGAGGVELVASLDNQVHHSHIHHNQRQGLGYGIVVSNTTDPATVLVEWNLFDYNRHSVAGAGAVGQSYEARNNYVLGHTSGHVFDMHGIDEASHDGNPNAGSKMLIHHNIVLADKNKTVVIRGRPSEGAWMYSNCLAHPTRETAFMQSHFTGNFNVDRSPSGPAANRYGRSQAECGPIHFCAMLGGAGPRLELAQSSFTSPLAVADFDGDGKADIFRTDGHDWWVSSAGKGSWERLTASAHELADLRFGDFDGDKKADVFRADGTSFWISRGGRGAWERLNGSAYPLAELRYGDFDGDGKTDVLRADGTAHWISRGGTSAWERLADSTKRVSDLAVGDFDGDGKTDITDARGIEGLQVGDFDGNGKDDLLRADGARWLVSWNGTSPWEVLAIASEKDLLLGDFDGDRKTDVLLRGCP